MHCSVEPIPIGGWACHGRGIAIDIDIDLFRTPWNMIIYTHLETKRIETFQCQRLHLRRRLVPGQ